MNEAFGGPFQLIDDTGLPAAEQALPHAYANWVQQQLAGMRVGDQAIVRFRRPRPTAAFSPQDTTHPRYDDVKEQARAFGFEPIERGTGGRLTMFDEHALGITILAPHPEPHQHMMKRYDILAGAIAKALGLLGVDARIGELPDEYCPGKFSVNAEGRVKLVGIAQRMNQRCLQMGAVIAVQRSDKACKAIAEAYGTMGLPFNAQTYGAIRDLQPQLTDAQICAAFVETVTAALA